VSAPTPEPVPFTELPDLAVRTLGGSVVYANDELYAERENLITPGPAVFSPATFGLKGQVYDGWETRRRREPGHDHAIVRLGVPGIIRGVVVDTSFFTGNYPPEVSVEATGAEGYPSPAELAVALSRAAADRPDAQAPLYALPTYTAMLSLRELLVARGEASSSR